jgi:hypothetical protein
MSSTMIEVSQLLRRLERPTPEAQEIASRVRDLLLLWSEEKSRAAGLEVRVAALTDELRKLKGAAPCN